MSSPTLYVGIDEAGYGPTLGPLVVASVALSGSADLSGVDWWDRLGPEIGRNGRSAFRVDDSKRVLCGVGGSEHLARTVEALLDLGENPALERLLRAACPDALPDIHAEHWFEPDPEPPADADPPDAGNRVAWDSALRRTGLRVERVRAEVVVPRRFNERLRRLANKAELELEIVSSLLSEASDCPHAVEATIDRLGGRRFYRPMLESVFGDRLVMTHREDASESRYEVEVDGRCVDVGFLVKADRHAWPTALASMVAKHLRERCMSRFNDFWRRHLPGLRPTAGYPGDAPRFLAEIEPIRRRLAIDKESLRRCR